MKDIEFTMTVIAPNNRHPFVFLKFFPTLDDAANWARDEIAMKCAEVILIRKGQYATDPVVWDSRKVPKPVPYCWIHCQVPTSFPLQTVNARFELRAASVLSDYEEPTNFEPDLSYPDRRYKDITVRTAWMMYLDLALEHFDRFGTVV